VGSDWQFLFDPSMSPADVDRVKNEFWSWYPNRGRSSPIAGALDSLIPGAGGPGGGGETPPGGGVPDMGLGPVPGGVPAPDDTGATTISDSPQAGFGGQAGSTAGSTIGGTIGSVSGGTGGALIGAPIGASLVTAPLGAMAGKAAGSYFGSKFDTPAIPGITPEAQQAFTAQRAGERAPAGIGTPGLGTGMPGPASDVSEAAGIGASPAGSSVGDAGDSGPGDSGDGGGSAGGDGGDGGFGRGGRVPRRTHPGGSRSAWRGAPRFQAGGGVPAAATYYRTGGAVSRPMSRAERVAAFEKHFGTREI
jgi:hypothetical protein